MKDEKLTKLYDAYKNLLTELQRNIFEDYYIFDLSLGEIAENNGVTRQSVNDTLKKAEKQLIKYETALKLAEKNDKLKSLLELLNTAKPAQIADLINSIIGE